MVMFAIAVGVVTGLFVILAFAVLWVIFPITPNQKENLKIAVSALKYIANSTPGPEQTFEIENKLAAQRALKEIGK